MPDELRERLALLAARAGLGGLPPAALLWAACLCVCAIGFAAWRWWGSGTASGEFALTTEETVTVPPAASTPASDAAGVVVHVVGAVVRPGVYTLPAGSRVADAVRAAGGLTGTAAPEGVNLARILGDGEQLDIPTEEELAAGVAAPGGSAPSVKGAAGPGSAGTLVNLNTAGESELDSLPGIGPSTASKIVQDREANGPFSSVEDLLRIPGIGPKKLDGLRDLVTVG